MILIDRFLIETEDGEKWVTFNHLDKDAKIIRRQMHFLPKENYIFHANESDEEKEYLIFNYDNEREWHDKLRDDYVPEE